MYTRAAARLAARRGPDVRRRRRLGVLAKKLGMRSGQMLDRWCGLFIIILTRNVRRVMRRGGSRARRSAAGAEGRRGGVGAFRWKLRWTAIAAGDQDQRERHPVETRALGSPARWVLKSGHGRRARQRDLALLGSWVVGGSPWGGRPWGGGGGGGGGGWGGEVGWSLSEAVRDAVARARVS